MTRAVWIAVAVVVGAALIWFAVGWEPSELRARPGVEQPSSNAPAARDSSAAPVRPQPSQAQQPVTSQVTPTPSKASSAAPATQSHAKTAPMIPLPERSGPVDELERLFQSETRDSTASRVEALAEAPFRRPEVPAGLLKSAICHRTVCRVETRWSPDRAAGFMAALMRLVADPSGEPAAFDSHLGIAPTGEPEPDGSREVDLYMRMRAP